MIRTRLLHNAFQSKHRSCSRSIIHLISSRRVVSTTSNNTKDEKNKNKKTSYNLFLSCAPGLEPILKSEVESLFSPGNNGNNGNHINNNNNNNKPRIEIEQGGITLKKVDSITQILKCHLHLGTASHILLRCGTPQKVRTFDEVTSYVTSPTMTSHWKSLLDIDALLSSYAEQSLNVELSISTSTRKSKLMHSGAISERVERGIYQSLGISLHDRKRIQREKEEDGSQIKEATVVKLVVRVYRDMIQISLDTSNTPLHRRGYRIHPVKAPLREDLAFAVLHSSGWNKQTLRSLHEEQEDTTLSLLDPFCGSGTLAIEAASIAHGLPPGRLRPPPLLGTHLYIPQLWQTILQNTTLPDKYSIKIMASDRDKGAIEAARDNANRAGLANLIHFQNIALSKCTTNWFPASTLKEIATPNTQLFIATNPPYGKRTSTSKSIIELHQKFGHVVQNILTTIGTTARIAMVGNDKSLIRRTGILHLNTHFMTNHGGLKIFLLSNTNPATNDHNVDNAIINSQTLTNLN